MRCWAQSKRRSHCPVWLELEARHGLFMNPGMKIKVEYRTPHQNKDQMMALADLTWLYCGNQNGGHGCNRGEGKGPLL